MTKLLLLIPLFILPFFWLPAQTTKSNEKVPGKSTPVSLVEQQVNAYNARNIDAFLEPYSDSVEIYTFPDKLISKGKKTMRREYSEFFNTTPKLHCEIKGRLVQGSTVIDKESITGLGSKPMEAIAIYQIEENKIQRVYFVE